MEVARRFGREGFRVGIVRRNTEALDAMIAELADSEIEARGLATDAHDPAALHSSIDALADELSGIDVLHHAVPGPLGAGYGRIIDVSPDLLRAFVDARVVSALVAAQAALPHLRRSRGCLLFTSGPADRNPHPGTGVVGVPQAALRMLTQHLRAELAEDGIFVGLIPVAGVPAYRDEEADAARTDVSAGMNLTPGRLSAADVAEAHYRMAMNREPEEWIVGQDQCGLAAQGNGA